MFLVVLSKYDDANHYIFIFLLTGALTADYILTVQVSDVNDVEPSCTSSLYSVTISESVATSTSVGQITCSDNDVASPNNVVSTYTILSGNTSKCIMFYMITLTFNCSLV